MSFDIEQLLDIASSRTTLNESQRRCIREAVDLIYALRSSLSELATQANILKEDAHYALIDTEISDK